MHRYEWKTVADDLYHLIDLVSRKPVASVERRGDQWHWHRNTVERLQGAPPAEGNAATLDEAQSAVFDGLPNVR